MASQITKDSHEIHGEVGRKRRPALSRMSGELHSILVIHQGALGDFILALPAFAIIRKAFSQARMSFLGYPRILRMAEKRFYADEILSIEKKEMAPLFIHGGVPELGLFQYIKSFDLIVVFGKDAEGTLIQNLRRIGHALILPVRSFPSDGEKIHVTDHLLRQFSEFGFPESEPSPRLYLTEADRKWARDFWRSRGVTPQEHSKTILLHPGSGSQKKVWPLDRFLRLAETLQNRLESKILIIIGPAEGPESRKTFEGMGPDLSILPEDLTLVELASVIEGCRFYIGNDSGISHLAAAVGLPAFVIFGPTDPDVWSPRGERTFVIYKKTDCSPCAREQWMRCEGIECLKNIKTGAIINSLEKIGVTLKIQRKEREDGREEDRGCDQIF